MNQHNLTFGLYMTAPYIDSISNILKNAIEYFFEHSD